MNAATTEKRITDIQQWIGELRTMMDRVTSEGCLNSNGTHMIRIAQALLNQAMEHVSLARYGVIRGE